MSFSIKQFGFILFLSVLLSASMLVQEPDDWQLLSPTPTARTEVAVVNHQDKIYLIGGFTPNGISDQVEVYDPKSVSWSKVAPLPHPRHHTTAVSTNGKIYVIGGFSSGMWTPVNTVYAFDAAKNEWTEQSPMPTERGALAAGVIDGKIYAVGGALKKFFRLRNTNANEVYDPKTDTWKKLMPIPTPRDHLTVSVANGLLYAIGGRVNVNYNQNLNAHEAYDPKTNQWQTRAPLPTARSGITSQYVNGKIYVFGGESGEGTFNENEAYDPKANQWTTMPPMPKSCHGLGSALVNGAIHLLNGGPHPGGGGSTYHQVFTPG
jgi:N-acetylneuraminic acid mutarotase